MTDAIGVVRRCLAAIKSPAQIECVSNDTPLLEQRVINSFDVIELILHLEHETGREVDRVQLAPGSFRDISTIARVFVEGHKK